MAPSNPQLDKEMVDLTAQAAATVGVIDSAVLVLAAFPAQTQKALDDYAAAHPEVTPDQLAGIQAAIDAQKKATDKLAEAIAQPGPVGGARG